MFRRKAFLLLGAMMILASQAVALADDAAAAAPPYKKDSSDSKFTMAIGVKASSLGLGIEAAVPLSHFVNLRGGFNGFEYSRKFAASGIQYDGTIRLRSVETLVDIFPFAGRFHISPGMLVYNGNQISADAFVPGGKTFSLGSIDLVSKASDPIHGTGLVSLNKAAPMVRWGFGNMVPHSGHFSFNIEGGAVFQGSPKVKLNLAGTGCDPVLGLVCHNLATDPTIQAQVQNEQTKINKDLTILKYYPAFSIGLSYKF